MATLRVLTYNLYFGGTDRLEEIYTVLAHVGADIIGLTEADDPAVVAALAARLGLHHIWAKGSGDRHIATLSRYPIAEWQIYRTPPLTQAVLETKLALPNGAISVYNAHFLPTLLLPFEVRRWQAVGKLLQVIQSRRPGAHLIMGDLNAIARGDRVLQRNNPARMRRLMALQLNMIFRLALPRLLKAGYTDCFRHLHPHDDGFTWMPGNLTTRYDYILADPAMTARLQTCRVIDNIEAVCTASDHLPLLAEFKL
ncbi:MAG: endonuclease/exonuclease/phosphatase family protein [Anaerolineales bacterium]|nr:endonuclease/exonuclease/phosphatase family protein [Anaerolineales bacterium]